MTETALSDAAAMLRQATHVVALTGAGVSAESGLPTFREAQTGLWAKYSPEQLATPQAFDRDPRLVWEWYAWRRSLVRAAEPNAAHHALARLEEIVPAFTLVTQNVDGLHRRAGSRNVHELHGDIVRTICSRERTAVESWEEEGAVPPACPRCGAPLRPDVVWFGEPLPAHALYAAAAAAGRCDVMLVVGTSLHVQPAASLVPIALDGRADVIIVNTEAPNLPAHPRLHVLTGSATGMLSELVRRVSAPGEHPD